MCPAYQSPVDAMEALVEGLTVDHRVEETVASVIVEGIMVVTVVPHLMAIVDQILETINMKSFRRFFCYHSLKCVFFVTFYIINDSLTFVVRG